MRLNEVCDQKQNTLNEKKIALDQLSKLTDHCIQFVTHALEKGSDMELLYSKRYFTKCAKIVHPQKSNRIFLTIVKILDSIVRGSYGSLSIQATTFFLENLIFQIFLFQNKTNPTTITLLLAFK